MVWFLVDKVDILLTLVYQRLENVQKLEVLRVSVFGAILCYRGSATMNSKFCSRCKEHLLVESFYLSSNHEDNLYPICKECAKAKRKANYEKNKEKILKKISRQYAEDETFREHRRLQSKKWRENNPEKVKETQKKRWINMTSEQRAERAIKRRQDPKERAYATRANRDKAEAKRLEIAVKLKKQNGLCVICERLLTLDTDAYQDSLYHSGRRNKNAYLDHCHQTEFKRAILCPPCNSMIGVLKEQIDKAQRLVSYIEWCNHIREKLNNNETPIESFDEWLIAQNHFKEKGGSE